MTGNRKKYNSACSVSVVIPAYNAERYLKHSVESVLQQSIKNMDIIIINDASTDKTLDVAKSLAMKDRRINVISLEENVGLGFVRNIGIEKARGDWISFLDADDKMFPNSLKSLIDVGVKYNCDIVKGGVKAFRENNGVFDEVMYKNSSFFNFDVCGVNIFNAPPLWNIPSCWSMIYRRDFININNIRFQRKFQEDMDFSTHCLVLAQSVSILGSVDYIWHRRHSASYTNSAKWNASRLRFMIDHILRVMDIIGKYYKKENKNDFLFYRMSYYWGVLVNSVFPNICEINESVVDLLGKLSNGYKKIGFDEEKINFNAEPYLYNKHERDEYKIILKIFLEDRVDFVIDLLKEEIHVNKIETMGLSNDKKVFVYNYLIKNNKLAYSDKVVETIIPPNIEKVYLHIGAMKTGSTALQNFLEINRDILLNDGLLYPKAGIFHENRNGSRRTSGHQGLVDIITKSKFENYLLFYNEIKDSGANSLVLSSENLYQWLTNIEQIRMLRKVLGNVDVEIVLYLRSPDDWIESMYKEAVSGTHFKETADFDEYVLQSKKGNILDIYGKLKMWESVFSREKINLRMYEEVVRTYKNGVVEDFLNIIGASQFGREGLVDAYINLQNMSVDDLLLLRSFNLLEFHSKPKYQKFVYGFIDMCKNEIVDSKVSSFYEVSRIDRVRVLGMLEKDMDYLKEKYGFNIGLWNEKAIKKMEGEKRLMTINISEGRINGAMMLYKEAMKESGAPKRRNIGGVKKNDEGAGNATRYGDVKKAEKMLEDPKRFFCESKKYINKVICKVYDFAGKYSVRVLNGSFRFIAKKYISFRLRRSKGGHLRKHFD